MLTCWWSGPARWCLFLAGELRLAGISVLVVERLAAPSETIKAGSIGPHRSSCRPARPARAVSGGGRRDVRRAGGPGRIRDRTADPRSGRPGDHAGPAVPGTLLRPVGAARRHRPGVPDPGAAGAPDRRRAGARRTCPAARRRTPPGARVGRPGRRHRRRTGRLPVRWPGRPGARPVPRGLRRRPQHRTEAGRLRLSGHPATITGRQAAVHIAEPNPLRPGWHRTDRGMVVFGPGPNRVLTVEFDGPPADRTPR